MEEKELINTGKLCPYCLKETELAPSSVVYGPNLPSYGYIYHCQSCFAYVGCHKGTTEALGRLANTELREYKKIAHAAFDPLWKHPSFISQGYSKLEARTAMYMWLSVMMGLDIADTHIGMFDIEQCKDVIHFCTNLNPFTKFDQVFNVSDIF